MAKRSLKDALGMKQRRKYGEGYSYNGDSFYTLEFTGSVSQSFRRFLQKKVFVFARSFSYLLSHASTKVYGAISLSFGLLTLFMYFLGLSEGEGIETAIIGIAFSLLSIPFLLSDKSLPIFLQDFVITDYVFYEFFCMKRANRMESTAHFPIPAAVVIGLLFAALGYLIPVWQIVLAVGILVFVYISFASPEFTFLISFLLLPYFRYIPYSSTCLVIMIAIAIVSFMRKVIYGKRVFHIEPYDVTLAVFTFLILISGIFVKGMESFSSSVEMIVLAMGYTLASNVITNRRLADCALNSVIISSVVPSMISIAQFSVLASRVGIANVTFLDVGELFVRKNELAPFLLVAVLLSVAMIIQSRSVSRVVYTAGIVLNFFALLLTGEFFAIFTLLLGAFVYLALKSKRFTLIVLPALLLVPYLLLFMIPKFTLDELFLSIPSLGTVEELFWLWGHSITAIANNFFVGIGIGAESFAEEMAKYGVYGYTNSSNLFIEIALEAGVLALLSFILLFIVRIAHRTAYLNYVKNSQTAVTARIGEVCVFCLLAFGTTNYIWSDMSAYYLFWCIFGIVSAAIRVAKKEFDDRVLYYEDTRALDYSVIDVEIG